MILDSSFVIDLLKGEKAAVQVAKELEEAPVSTTSITVFEIFQGAKDSELAPIRKFFAQMTVLPLGHDEAERAGLIQKQLKAAGKSIDPEDCMIAGIALQHKKKIVTRNSKHFEKIPGVSIVSY